MSNTPEGYEHAYADVNGTKLHYVVGGEGEPLFLMTGYPRTWYYYHRVMPKLAEHFRVHVVEIRGMGDSGKPESGYDKKNMAQDVYELIRSLGYKQAYIEGEDIGGMVAWSLAVNHPEVVKKLIVADGVHPNDGMYKFSMVQPPEARQMLFPFWWVMGQIPELPAKLFAGKAREIIDWNIAKIGGDSPEVFTEDVRAAAAAGYDTPESIEATNKWFETFYQDIIDYNGYPKLSMPLVYFSGKLMPVSAAMVDLMVDDVTYVEFPGAGHFLAEERPEQFVAEIVKVFGA
ncbi:alpha/beta fold hydrolase [Actinacidiphila glaucinigra]|uniref:alpha/beta fold hydrolase n=1 Tax=Actinacidiphila glaucinigra TaxID=235986 RepID=UPI00371306C2